MLRGINNAGTVIGTYGGSDGFSHSFASIPPVSSPEILFHGTNIATKFTKTMPPPTVVVGQQVLLQALVPTALGAVVSQQWHFAGKPIGGYSPTATSFQIGSVLPLVTNQPSATFYWNIPTDPGEFYIVEYTYTLANGQTGTIETKFSVAPAPTPIMSPPVEKTSGVSCVGSQTSYCDIFYQTVNNNQVLYMGFGNISPNLGIKFSTSTSTVAGSLQWVQLIKQEEVDRTSISGKVQKCIYSLGLDSKYPYPGGIDNSGNYTANDSPAAPLYSDEKQVTRLFAAQMYLMWTSNTINSIPVPLGSITWSFNESSKADSTAPFGWDTPTVIAQTEGFLPSTQSYPTWKALAQAGKNCNAS